MYSDDLYILSGSRTRSYLDGEAAHASSVAARDAAAQHALGESPRRRPRCLADAWRALSNGSAAPGPRTAHHHEPGLFAIAQEESAGHLATRLSHHHRDLTVGSSLHMETIDPRARLLNLVVLITAAKLGSSYVFYKYAKFLEGYR